MKIVVMKYGEALYSRRRIFFGAKEDDKIPMSFCFYLLETKGKNILVDVGCRGKERYDMYAYIEPTELLKSYGFTPDDITDIIVTHAHFDHVDNIAVYKNAVIHIQEDEYYFGKEKIDVKNTVELFSEEKTLYERIHIKKVGAHTRGSSIVIVGEYVLCGDECYFMKNIDEKIPTGNSYYPEKSRQFVQDFAKMNKKPLFFHDGSILSGKAGFLKIYED